MKKFDQTLVTCSNTGKIVLADILEKTDKTLKVALVGTNMTLQLKKSMEKPFYIGNCGNLEFTATGEGEENAKR